MLQSAAPFTSRSLRAPVARTAPRFSRTTVAAKGGDSYEVNSSRLHRPRVLAAQLAIGPLHPDFLPCRKLSSRPGTVRVLSLMRRGRANMMTSSRRPRLQRTQRFWALKEEWQRPCGSRELHLSLSTAGSYASCLLGVTSGMLQLSPVHPAAPRQHALAACEPLSFRLKIGPCVFSSQTDCCGSGLP